MVLICAVWIAWEMTYPVHIAWYLTTCVLRFISSKWVSLIDLRGRIMICCVQKWNGDFFEHVTLKDLGLRIQLGHALGVRCLNPRPATGNEFTVVHSNGIHSVALDFCACETAPGRIAQLLRSRLFPATAISPRAAATFHVLQHFQVLSFESKVSAFEYYNTLSQLTDNIISPPPVGNSLCSTADPYEFPIGSI